MIDEEKKVDIYPEIIFYDVFRSEGKTAGILQGNFFKKSNTCAPIHFLSLLHCSVLHGTSLIHLLNLHLNSSFLMVK